MQFLEINSINLIKYYISQDSIVAWKTIESLSFGICSFEYELYDWGVDFVGKGKSSLQDYTMSHVTNFPHRVRQYFAILHLK